MYNLSNSTPSVWFELKQFVVNAIKAILIQIYNFQELKYRK